MSETTKLHNAQVVQIALDELHPSPTNRPERSGFDAKSIAELAESIRGPAGIIEPLIVRKNAKGYEIVCGERRWTAAKLIKLATVPCIVRKLEDNEARKLQIIENLQREGLHPVEEAQGYADLLAQKDAKGQPVNTIESIAKEIGKSAAFVYGRMKLLKMPKVALEASFVDKLNASNALLIARIPDPKLAYKATLELLDPYGSGDGPEREKRALDPDIEAMSHRKAKEHIQTNYMKRLKGTPFNQEDADLVPVEIVDGERRCGGKCSDCPWRTGNMQTLFQDVGTADVCTNPVCFRRKQEAAWKQAHAKAKAQGHTLLSEAKAGRLFSNGELHPHQSDYVDLRGTFPGEKKKTWEQVLGERLPDNLVQALDDKRKLHFLLPVEAAVEAAKKAGHAVPKEFVPERTDPEERRCQEEQRQKQRQRAEMIAVALAKEVLAKAEATAPTTQWWRWMLTSMLDGSEQAWASRFGCMHGESLMDLIAKASEAKCRSMMVAVASLPRLVTWQGEMEDSLLKACEFYKIDHKKIITQKQGEFRVEDKANAELAKLKAKEAEADRK
jgi:ParB/RepB/Spo0J family partition protein